MATTLDEIVLRLEAQGAEQAAARVRGVAGAVRDLDAAGDAAAAGGMGNAAMSLGGLAFAAQGAIGMIGVVSGMLATLSGVRIAAQFEDIALSLQTVTGSAEKAKRLLEDLEKLGAQTPFDTAELSQFAAQLIAAGTSAENVVGQLRTLADLAAYSFVPRADMPRFFSNLLQMRGQPTPEMTDLKEMVRLSKGIGAIVAAGTGSKTPMTSIEAMNKLQTMTGQQAFDTIIRGTEKIAKNAAIMAGMLSPINAFANMMENIQMIMKPTGQIILEVLKPIVAFASKVAGWLGDLNKFTKGFAGLNAIVLIVRGSWGMLTTSLAAAKMQIESLIASINRLAISAATAANSVGRQAGNPARGGMFVGPGGKRMMKGMGIAMAAEGASWAADEWLPEEPRWAKIVKASLHGAALGASLGFMFLGGPQGALIGGGIGAVAGGGMEWWNTRPNPDDAAADKLDTTNQILKDIKGSLGGGGARAGVGIASAELEIAIARRFAMGYG